MAARAFPSPILTRSAALLFNWRAATPRKANLPEPDLAQVAVYRVEPTVISVLDYSRGFGHSDLVYMNEPALSPPSKIWRQRRVHAVQEFVGLRGLAGPLDLDEAHRALAAGDRQAVEDRAGRAHPRRQGRAQRLDALGSLAPIGLEPGAGEGRQAPDMVVNRLAPAGPSRSAPPPSRSSA